MSDKGSAYQSAGVDYEKLDAAKRDALAQALATSSLLDAHGGKALDESRGETAFVFEFGDRSMAIVLECLGTKSVIAREFQEATGIDRFADIAYDSVAAIANDLCCVGALPLVINAYFATGSGDWYSVGDRQASLISGWRDACEAAGATWGGGESPTLSGVIDPKEIDLAGCAVGYIPEGNRPILGGDLRAGDAIVIVESSGLHANGATLARRVASESSEGLRTVLSGGRMLGDALLAPAPIYVPLVRLLLERGTHLSYMSHITGHGFRKLMRARHGFTYRITQVPEVPEILSFLVEELSIGAREAYGTFNMGAGFAIYTRPDDAPAVIDAAEEVGLEALVAGRVEKGPKRVIVDPLDITFEETDLQLR